MERVIVFRRTSSSRAGIRASLTAKHMFELNPHYFASVQIQSPSFGLNFVVAVEDILVFCK